jgi:hypothetical protein
MKATHRWLIAVVCGAALAAAACGPASQSGATSSASAKDEPSRVEPIEGTELSRVILTDEAARRLDVQTEAASTEEVDGVQHIVVPYSAVIYDVQGEAWVYTSPEPLTFVRHSLEIDSIDGDMAVLSDGPPAGTQIVTVGAPEIYGAEFEFVEG